MVVKVLLLIVFFAVMIGVGVYARKHATNVNGFVLGGQVRGTVAHRLCLWDILLLGSCIRRICGTVWISLRNGIHMDRYRERPSGVPAGLGSARAQNPDYDEASQIHDYAGFLRKTL